MAWKWTNDQRFQLEAALLTAIRSTNDLERLVRRGLAVPLVNIVAAGNLQDMVFDLMDWVEARDKEQDLLWAALNANPDNGALRTFAGGLGLVQENPAPVAGDPGGGLLAANPSLVTPGADTTQLQGGAVAPVVWVSDYMSLVKRAAGVARVRSPQMGAAPGAPLVDSGTAWLVAPGVAITCWHVIATAANEQAVVDEATLRRQAAGSQFTFDFTAPGAGTDYALGDEAGLLVWNQTLDYALLRLADRPARPLVAHGVLPIDLAPVLTAATDLVVIQHPAGQPQQAGPGLFVDWTDAARNRIYHRAFAQGGTSGAPVFNLSDWRAVALHRADGLYKGERLRIATLLGPIFADLQQQQPTLHQEIMQAQAALMVAGGT